MKSACKKLLFFFLIFYIVSSINSEKSRGKNKYSKEANEKFEGEKYDSDFRNIKKPFRISKLNLIWTKAVHRLTEPKLKSLYTELKLHDKEEIALKHLKTEKLKEFSDGISEASMRQKLIGIMSNYGLLEVLDIEDVENSKPKKQHKPKSDQEKSDSYKNKSMFKDKKLNKLWEKAELSHAFSPEEMDTLKQELQHHEEKVDFYYSLIENLGNSDKRTDQHKNAINEEELDNFNEVARSNEEMTDIYQEQKNTNKHDDYTSKANDVREKHREIRDNLDRLERIVARGTNSSDFIEPKVQGLWRIAQDSNFTADELASLKVELHHFESRFLKLRHMHAEHALSLEKSKKGAHPGDKYHDKVSELENNIKKQTRKVEKLQENLEKRLLKHTEL